MKIAQILSRMVETTGILLSRDLRIKSMLGFRGARSSLYMIEVLKVPIFPAACFVKIINGVTVELEGSPFLEVIT